MGYVPRRYESSLVLFYLDHDIDFSSKEFKFAALILRVMVMMAQIDREILSEEEQEIKSLILNLSFLTTNEKRVLLAKSTCLFNDSLNGRLTFYDYTIQKICELDTKSQDLVIDLIKLVAVSDGYIDASEKKLLRDIYNALELPTENITKELEYTAKDKGFELRDYKHKQLTFLMEDETRISDYEFDSEDLFSENW